MKGTDPPECCVKPTSAPTPEPTQSPTQKATDRFLSCMYGDVPQGSSGLGQGSSGSGSISSVSFFEEVLDEVCSSMNYNEASCEAADCCIYDPDDASCGRSYACDMSPDDACGSDELCMCSAALDEVGVKMGSLGVQLQRTSAQRTEFRESSSKLKRDMKTQQKTYEIRSKAMMSDLQWQQKKIRGMEDAMGDMQTTMGEMQETVNGMTEEREVMVTAMDGMKVQMAGYTNMVAMLGGVPTAWCPFRKVAATGVHDCKVPLCPSLTNAKGQALCALNTNNKCLYECYPEELGEEPCWGAKARALEARQVVKRANTAFASSKRQRGYDTETRRLKSVRNDARTASQDADAVWNDCKI